MRKICPLDITVFIIFIAVLAVSFVQIYGKKQNSAVLLITSPDAEYIYAMSENREILIKGKIGESKIVISEGCAFFADSPCPNKNCINAGKISVGGQWTACLPNGIFIRLEGAETSDAESF